MRVPLGEDLNGGRETEEQPGRNPHGDPGDERAVGEGIGDTDDIAITTAYA